MLSKKLMTWFITMFFMSSISVTASYWMEGLHCSELKLLGMKLEHFKNPRNSIYFKEMYILEFSLKFTMGTSQKELFAITKLLVCNSM